MHPKRESNILLYTVSIRVLHPYISLLYLKEILSLLNGSVMCINIYEIPVYQNIFTVLNFIA